MFDELIDRLTDVKIAAKYTIADSWTVDGGTVADEASDNGSDAGDTDNTADGIARASAISSKFHIVTTKVRLAVSITVCTAYYFF